MNLPVLWVMPTARRRSGPIASACCSTATARASSRWRRALIPNAFRPSISRCITSLPKPCGAMPLCCRQSADMLCQRSNATAWIVDDTGIPKKGRHSVGVARQYCGQLGKQDNCQVAVTLSLANDRASLPVAYRLYLPEAWAGDPERRATAGIPQDIAFQTKPQIALDQIRAACAAGLPRGIVLTDAAYGTDFRTGLTALGLTYAVGIQSSTTVWAPGTRPLPPKPWSGKGRRPTLLRRDDDHQPVPVKDLALSLPASQWRSVTWRAGTNTSLRSRFASVRVPAAHRDDERAELRSEEWLLVEWPDSEAEPTQYWLSTLPADTALQDLMAAAKGRWRIERDYEELKQEIGLNHYEGRGWRGFHHHATLCIAAYGFLIAERCLFPPRQRLDRRQGQAPAPACCTEEEEAKEPPFPTVDQATRTELGHPRSS